MKVIALASALYQAYLREAADSRLETAMGWHLVAPDDWKLRLEGGCGQPVDHVRRTIIRRLLARAPECPTDEGLSHSYLSAAAADVVVWADHDVAYCPEDVVRLCKTLLSEDDIGIVAAPVPQQERAGKLTVNVNLGPDQDKNSVDWSWPFPIRSAGFGLTACRMSVFEEIAHPWFDFVETQNDDGEWNLAGEDMGFCVKVAEAGFRVLCEPRVRPHHIFLRAFTLESAHDSVMMHLTRSRADDR